MQLSDIIKDLTEKRAAVNAERQVIEVELKALAALNAKAAALMEKEISLGHAIARLEMIEAADEPELIVENAWGDIG